MTLEYLFRYLFVLGVCVYSSTAVRERKVQHLQEIKFADEEYQDLDSELDERESGPEPPISPDDQPFRKKFNLSYGPPVETKLPDKLDSNIQYISRWGARIDFGQISGVSVDPSGNIGIFHRGERIWDSSTFGKDNKFNINRGPIRDSTIMLLDKSGRKILEWGMNMFYLPHGLTIDFEGNYWLTDVAMHQVFKFSGKDIETHKQQLNRQRHSQRINVADTPVDLKNLFANSIVKPSLTLGIAFQPGNDNERFCKPTAVAVLKNGDFFVSDGYCNSRVIKFNKKGERITEWGRTWSFKDKALNQNTPPRNVFVIPHALTLAEERDFIFVADRENGRIVCNFASNGTFHKEYKNPVWGGAVYSIAYANNKLYIVNGNPFFYNPHVRGFVLDVDSGEVTSQFAPYPEDMNNPHDIAVTPDGKEIYVVELNSHRIYRFNQAVRNLKSTTGENQSKSLVDARSSELIDGSLDVQSKKPSQRGLIMVVIVAALIFIGFCIFLAALLARYQKRGCLFPPYKRTDWNSERNDNFKLSSLLDSRKRFKIFENRPNTKDFSKVNTEPETSDEEILESMERII